MALKKRMSDGTEGTCYRCGKPMVAHEMLVLRSSGTRGNSWVHEKCGPGKQKRHNLAARGR